MGKLERNLEAAAETSLNDIRRDLDKKIDEIKADIKRKGPDAAEGIEDSLDALKASLEARLGDFHTGIDDELEMGRREIKRQPLTAVGVAVLVGVLAGMLLGRK